MKNALDFFECGQYKAIVCMLIFLPFMLFHQQSINKHNFLGPLILIANTNATGECQVVSMIWNKICPNLPNIPVGQSIQGRCLGCNRRGENFLRE